MLGIITGSCLHQSLSFEANQPGSSPRMASLDSSTGPFGAEIAARTMASLMRSHCLDSHG